MVLPIVGCGALVFFFLNFVTRFLFGNGSLTGLTFKGFLFIANLILIMVIFTSFFIEVKLIPTLWLLLFLSPITFFISQRALTEADCTIGEYNAPSIEDKKSKKE
jgi:hypothetical protein